MDYLVSISDTDGYTLPEVVKVPASRIPDLADAIAAAGVGELPGRGAIPYWENEVGPNPILSARITGLGDDLEITPASPPDLRYSSLGLKLQYYGTTETDYITGGEFYLTLDFSADFGQAIYDAMARPTDMTLNYFVGIALVWLGNTMVVCQYEFAMGVWGASLSIAVPVPAGVTTATEIGLVI